MIHIKDMPLKPLISSKPGIHLSSYIVNTGGALSLRQQVLNTINRADDYLKPVMSSEERLAFLEPLFKLARDSKTLSEFRGNIGLFRKHDSFRILNLPIDVEPLCVVASSFHVKPLIKWQQVDRDFLLVGLEPGKAYIYKGSMGHCTLLDTVVMPKSMDDFFIDDGSYESLKQARRFKLVRLEIWDWIDTFLKLIPESKELPLFVAGEHSLATELIKHLKAEKKHSVPIHYSFDEGSVEVISNKIRQLRKSESKLSLKQAIFEFHMAGDSNLTGTGIHQVAQAASSGRIEKLFIADDTTVFGKICQSSGSISVHPEGLDHEDDDLLDDLAQQVLIDGGEVIVAPQRELPLKEPVLAILKRQIPELPALSSSLSREASPLPQTREVTL